MNTTATRRFVNLNKTRTYIPGPDGQQVIVMPFEDSLSEHTRKSEATYVVEGDWWAQFVGAAGPLFPFPSPRAYGLETFPDLPASCRRSDETGPARVRADAQGADVAVAASLGRRRATGDVLTPDGRIRTRDPITGEERLLPDTPENRNMVHSDFRTGRATALRDSNSFRQSFLDEMERLGIMSHKQFLELPDATMLQIPGVTEQNLPFLRKNIGDYLARLETADDESEAAPPVAKLGKKKARRKKASRRKRPE